ncbi:hypothetical protein M432DRAFT_21335 [Thermoascus aurantiacus ATCC 26904]
MRPLSPVLASLANAFRIPISSASASRPAVCNDVLRKTTTTTTTTTLGLAPQLVSGTIRPFSTTSSLAKRKGEAPKLDKRITLIRYFLWHPKTPRPLRFSRTRYLRHWTIHRAWQLYQAQRRRARELELQRMWQAMRDACEELRTGIGDGGKLFRKSMIKKGVFKDLFPIEYGRMQTEGPSKDGWNHEWKRQ